MAHTILLRGVTDVKVSEGRILSPQEKRTGAAMKAVRDGKTVKCESFEDYL